MRICLAADRVVAPGVTARGWVDVDGGRILDVGAGSPPAGATRLAGCTIVPGFVDIHVHGGGGHSMTAGDPEAVAGAARFHRAHGTTTSLVSLVTASLDDLIAASRRIAGLIAEAPDDLRGQLAGIHLEGPFLAVGRCGAQNPEHMTDPTPDAVTALIEAGGGHLRVVTIAPERAGALDAIRQLVAAGVVAAVGHTDATWEQTSVAIAAGASLATHLGNAMPPLHHRAPGPVGACLGAPDLTCELILDGHHLHPSMVSMVSRSKGAGHVALITDAISAAGSNDGRYVLGALDVEVAGGVARLVNGGSLAGSTLTMDVAFRNAVAGGLSLDDASAAASTNPARVLGRHDETGEIAAGRRADLVVLGADNAIRAVVAAGELVAGEL